MSYPNKKMHLLNRGGQMVQAVVNAELEPLTAGDVLSLDNLIMCQGRRVKNVHLEVLEVEGAVATVSVGTVADPVAFLNGVDVNAVAQYLSADALATLMNADTQLIITIVDNMAKGKFAVKVLFDDFTTDEPIFTQIIK